MSPSRPFYVGNEGSHCHDACHPLWFVYTPRPPITRRPDINVAIRTTRDTILHRCTIPNVESRVFIQKRTVPGPGLEPTTLARMCYHSTTNLVQATHRQHSTATFSYSSAVTGAPFIPLSVDFGGSASVHIANGSWSITGLI